MNPAGEGAQSRPGKGVTFAYGHDTKKFRLRAVSAEKDAYAKFINKPLATKISATQIGLAVLIACIQIITIGLVVGRFSYYDGCARVGVGIWTSFISAFAAVMTGWSIRNTRYWKLHVAFALHIFNVLATILLVCSQFGGNIPDIRYRIGEELYGDGYGYNGNRDKISVPLMTVSLILNSMMASAGLAQLVASFVMTLMTGRAICCGQSKVK